MPAAARRRVPPQAELVDAVVELGELGTVMTNADVDLLMERVPQLFRLRLREAAYPERRITAVMTKFRDAGRRTPPTAPASSIGPGLPQNAADGNRTNRWELPTDHRYYAPKREAQLVEIRFYLQALSMIGAPAIPHARAATAFLWLLGHELRPGEYKDPITLRNINFDAFVQNPKRVESGHYIPLARGGRHEPENTYLMLSRSNSLQSDLTFTEFLALIADIIARQDAVGVVADANKLPTHAFLEEAEGVVAE